MVFFRQRKYFPKKKPESSEITEETPAVPESEVVDSDEVSKTEGLNSIEKKSEE
jgi:hypothetical protein